MIEKYARFLTHSNYINHYLIITLAQSTVQFNLLSLIFIKSRLSGSELIISKIHITLSTLFINVKGKHQILKI